MGSVYIATASCAKLFGGRKRGQLRHEFQATHDLGLAKVYLAIRRNDPATARQWYGEDLIGKKFRTKQPDAVIASRPTKRPRLVIEFGGAYQASRIRAFHEHCEKLGLPYEIW